MAETATTTDLAGLDEVLAGCASCCDGVLAQARAAGASDSIISKLEQARDLCRSVADELPSA
jgi:hypothetical protein